jgi:hypothetical protein
MTNLRMIENTDFEEPVIDDAVPRAELRKALEERDAALALRDKAAATVEAARRHLRDVENELCQYDDLDEKIATKRAGVIAESLEAGGGVPDLDIPELHELIVKRGEANNRHAAFTMALTKLEANLDEANATLRARQADVDKSALRIVGCVADNQARELRLAEQITADMRRKLLGATVMRPPGSQIPLSSATMKLLRDDCLGALISKNDTSQGALWNSLFTRLSRGDSEARLGSNE